MKLKIHRVAVTGMMVFVMALVAVTESFASQPNTTGGQAPVATTALPKEKEGSNSEAKHKKVKKKSRAPWMHRVHGKLVVKPRSLAWHLNKKWFGVKHWWALDKLIYRESSWNPWETYGDACGLPQAKPCGKIPNWRSIKSQLVWMMKYIKGRYGNPTNALYFQIRNNGY